MALLAFEPQTAIEQRILDVQAQTYSADALMREMASHDLYIPSKGEVQEDGRGLVPVLLEQGGMPFVMVFTALSRRPRGLAEYHMLSPFIFRLTEPADSENEDLPFPGRQL